MRINVVEYIGDVTSRGTVWRLLILSADLVVIVQLLLLISADFIVVWAINQLWLPVMCYTSKTIRGSGLL